MESWFAPYYASALSDERIFYEEHSLRIYFYDETHMRTCKEAQAVLHYYCREMGCEPPNPDNIRQLYILTTLDDKALDGKTLDDKTFTGYVLFTSDDTHPAVWEVSAYIVPERRNQGYLRRFTNIMSRRVCLPGIQFVVFIHLKNRAAVSAIASVERTAVSLRLRVCGQSRL